MYYILLSGAHTIYTIYYSHGTIYIIHVQALTTCALDLLTYKWNDEVRQRAANTTLYCFILLYTTLHYLTLLYTIYYCALLYTTLHYFTLLYTTLHYLILDTLHYCTMKVRQTAANALGAAYKCTVLAAAGTAGVTPAHVGELLAHIIKV